mgnify:CR=1 FL=1
MLLCGSLVVVAVRRVHLEERPEHQEDVANVAAVASLFVLQTRLELQQQLEIESKDDLNVREHLLYHALSDLGFLVAERLQIVLSRPTSTNEPRVARDRASAR